MAAQVATDCHGGRTLYADVQNAPGVVYLGISEEEARAKARELIAVLDAFVRPWFTDGSVPKSELFVEILVHGDVVLSGAWSTQNECWLVDYERGFVAVQPDQVKGWRFVPKLKVVDGWLSTDDGAGRR